jgi:hypothetical protein
VVKTVADPRVREALVARLRSLDPATPRKWGTLTPHEMLCHLGDAAEMALRTRPRIKPVEHHRRVVLKWLGLWSPVRWLHGWKSHTTVSSDGCPLATGNGGCTNTPTIT